MDKIINIIKKNSLSCIASRSGHGKSLLLKSLSKKMDGLLIDGETFKFSENPMKDIENIENIFKDNKKIIFFDNFDHFIDLALSKIPEDIGRVEIGRRSRFLGKTLAYLSKLNINIVFSHNIMDHRGVGPMPKKTTLPSLSSLSRSVTYSVDSLFSIEKENQKYKIGILKDRGSNLSGKLIYDKLVYSYNLDRFVTQSDLHKKEFIQKLKE